MELELYQLRPEVARVDVEVDRFDHERLEDEADHEVVARVPVAEADSDLIRTGNFEVAQVSPEEHPVLRVHVEPPAIFPREGLLRNDCVERCCWSAFAAHQNCHRPRKRKERCLVGGWFELPVDEEVAAGHVRVDVGNHVFWNIDGALVDRHAGRREVLDLGDRMLGAGLFEEGLVEFCRGGRQGRDGDENEGEGEQHASGRFHVGLLIAALIGGTRHGLAPGTFGNILACLCLLVKHFAIHLF